MLVREPFEAVDDLRELARGERPAQGRKADQVGEADREGAVRRRRLRRPAPQRGQQVPPPDVAEELLEAGGQRLDPCRELGECGFVRRRLGAQPLQPLGGDGHLRIGDAGERLADDPGEL